MFPNPPSFLDWLLGLPLIPLAAWLISLWSGLALLVDIAILPWVAGAEGRKLGTCGPEVACLSGLLFAFLLSTNGAAVWERYRTAVDAVRTEAAALREIADLSSELSTERRRDVKIQLQTYLRYLIQTEWSRLGTGNVDLERPLPLRTLARVVRAGSNDELHAAISAAISARETRVRMATDSTLPACWSLIALCGALTITATGLAHAQHPRRARAITQGLLSFGIACCFLVFLAHARPFLGVAALAPRELMQLAAELSNP